MPLKQAVVMLPGNVLEDDRILQRSRVESVAEFRRRVPSVHSAGFFDEKRELGAADLQSGPAAQGDLPPDQRSTATSTVEKRRLSASILRLLRRFVKLQVLL